MTMLGLSNLNWISSFTCIKAKMGLTHLTQCHKVICDTFIALLSHQTTRQQSSSFHHPSLITLDVEVTHPHIFTSTLLCSTFIFEVHYISTPCKVRHICVGFMGEDNNADKMSRSFQVFIYPYYPCLELIKWDCITYQFDDMCCTIDQENGTKP